MVRTLRATGIALLSLIATGGCGAQQPHDRVPPRLPRATPPPRFKDPIEKVSREQLLRYARSLVFDTLAGVGDQQRLMLGSCPDNCRYGPLVEIQPEIGAATLDIKALASGRIVGRFVNKSSTPYDKLAIPPSQESFVWVDSIGETWRAYIIPTDSKLPVTLRSLGLERHGKPRWYQSLARWKWREDDEAAWITCTIDGCCKIDP